jgi:leucyl-tRNA synthetase
VTRMGEGTRMETDTMPGYAGSSWYFLRYMDPANENEFCSKEASDYWEHVDFYVGGSEHAVGHLLYSRFWHKFLKDKGLVKTEEPFKKMVNQGMIQGRSLLTKDNQIKGLNGGLHIPLSFTSPVDKIYKDQFQKLITEDNRFEKLDLNNDVHWESDKEGRQFLSLEPQVEKMSKRYLNVVNPDDMVLMHGADCFRMYEMFLGPIDTAKPWDTNGISGVANFLRKFWRLFYDDMGNPKYSTEKPTDEELKIVHTCIKKVGEDIERLSFNTCISGFMIAVNEYGKVKSPSLEALELLIRLICPFAPHTAETLWDQLGYAGFAVDAQFPIQDEKYLIEENIVYPVQVNGKLRANIEVPKEMSTAAVEQAVLSNDQVIKYFEGKTPKKIIVVPGRIVNIVL